jgi:hypothetical protein
MMAEARNTYLSGDRPLTAAERALLVRLTVLFERIVWMVHSYAELILRSMGAPPPAGSPEPV